jgi:hypothetical protein
MADLCGALCQEVELGRGVPFLIPRPGSSKPLARAEPINTGSSFCQVGGVISSCDPWDGYSSDTRPSPAHQHPNRGWV